MATEKLLPDGDDNGWPTGDVVDVDEGIASADGAFMATTIDDDVVIFDLGPSAIVDVDTVTGITIVIRALSTGSGGKDKLAVALRIDGTDRAQVSTPNLSGSFVDYTLNDADWNQDWTAAQMDGAQVRVRADQTGMGTAATWEVDCFDVDVVFTPGNGGTLFFQDTEGVLSFAGALSKQTNKQVAGGLTFAGALNKFTSVSVAGVLSFAGGLVKQTRKAIAGVLSFAGGVTAIVIFLKSVAGALSFGGGLSRQTNKVLAGTLTSSGALVKDTRKNVAGTLTFSGVLSKLVDKQLAGTLSFVGTLATTILFSKAVTGTLSFIGGLMTTFIPGGAGPTIRRMWRSVWSRVWKATGTMDEDV